MSNRFIVPLVVLCVALMICSFWVIGVGYAVIHSYSQPHATISTQAGRTPDKADYDKESTEINRTQMWFNGGLLVVTALQFAWTLRQLRTNRAELRAYVSFQITNLDKDPVAGEEYTMRFDCRNHGQTPALNLGFVGGIWCLDFPIDRTTFPKNSDRLDENRGNLFPNENMADKNLGFAPNTHAVFQESEISAVKAGKKIFIIGLKIQYWDVFGERHETEEYWCIGYANNGRRVAIMPDRSRVT